MMHFLIAALTLSETKGMQSAILLLREVGLNSLSMPSTAVVLRDTASVTSRDLSGSFHELCRPFSLVHTPTAVLIILRITARLSAVGCAGSALTKIFFRVPLRYHSTRTTPSHSFI